LVAIVIAMGCSAGSGPSIDPAVAAPDPTSVGTLTGRVVLDGAAPPATVMRLDGDPKCEALAAGEERRTEYVVVGADGGVQHVFVYIKDGLPPRLYPVPAAAIVLDQQKCRYVPRVFGIQVGQPLTIRNSDPLLHNVRSESLVNAPFDVSTPVQGVELTRTFATREVMVPFMCNVHGWMNAYAGVVEHPFFAVTDAGGTFTIPNVPPGAYTIEIWHERLGVQTQLVNVSAGMASGSTFTYKVS
jgi:hypothetical protein